MLFVGFLIVAVLLCCLVDYVVEGNTNRSIFNEGRCQKCGREWEKRSVMADGRSALVCSCGHSVIVDAEAEDALAPKRVRFQESK